MWRIVFEICLFDWQNLQYMLSLLNLTFKLSESVDIRFQKMSGSYLYIGILKKDIEDP